MVTIIQIFDHYKTHRLTKLASQSQRIYGYALDLWRPNWRCNVDDAKVAASAIYINVRDERPGLARMFVIASSVMFKTAIRDGLIPGPNPMADFPKPTMGHNIAWPSEAYEKFMATCDDSELKIAVALGYHTAQRLFDVVHATWGRFDDDGTWTITQQKTKKQLRIPLSGELRRLLECGQSPNFLDVWPTGRRESMAIAAGVKRHLKSIGYGHLTFHGLRHAAAVRMAEAGCTAPEIAAMTGHRTLGMVQHYISDADQYKLAVAALEKVERRR